MNFIPLEDVAEIIMGQSPPSSTYNNEGRGLPFFQGKADFGDLYPRNRVFCSAPQKIAEKGDILISVRAPVGPTNISHDRSAIGRGLAVLRCRSNLDAKWLLYFLRYYEPELAGIGKGSTFEAISRSDLEDVCIPLPPLPEQQRIVAILERADRLRRLRLYALGLSEGYLQAVFVEMFGDPVRNPMGWEEGQLARLCAKTIDCPHATPVYSTDPTPYACVRSSDIQNGYLDWSTTKYVSESEYRGRVERLVPAPNDVVYCREGARFGNAAIIPKNIKICLGQRMMLFRAVPGIATAEFVWATLESEAIYIQAERLAGGSASPHVNVQDIKAFTVMIPPFELQRQFTHVAQKHNRLRAQQREALRQAEQLFGALLGRAFRGEV